MGPTSGNYDRAETFRASDAPQLVIDTGLALDAELPELDRPLGEELLTPTAIYARDCLALAAECEVHAFAHITGGGLAGNLARVLPAGTGAVLERGSWRPQPVFRMLAARGGLALDEAERVFNMGVGMAAVVAAGDADRALRLLAGRGVTAWHLGEVSGGTEGVSLTGAYAQ